MNAPIDISKDRLKIDDLAPAWAQRAQAVGLGALGVSLVLGFIDSEAFLRAYVQNFMFVLSIVLAALFFVMLQHLTRAGWSVTVRRLAELMTTAFPVMAALALPVVLAVLIGWPAAVEKVYPWTSHAVAEHSHAVHHKAPYLSTTFFVVRVLIYFAVWLWLANYMFRRSLEQDETGDPSITSRMGRVAAPGMILFALTLTFAAVDFLMTMAPTWYSTIFGVYYFAGGVLAFVSVLALSIMWLQRNGRMVLAVSAEHYHDMGKLIFAFTVFWSYIAFSQYMLQWYANIPEETQWYMVRQKSPWLWLSFALLFGHFIIPFLALISRHPKRRPGLLLLGACWMLLMHWLDMLYLAGPPYYGLLKAPHGMIGAGDALAAISVDLYRPLQIPLSIALGVAMAGLAGAHVLRRAERVPLVPQRDPRLNESLAFENY